MARFFQKFSRLSVPPNNVVKIVESASRICPARSSFGGIQMKELNSVLPAAVKRMRAVEVNGLACEHMDGFGVLGGQRVVRQVGMKVEGRDVVEQAELVQVLVDREWRDLLCL